MKPIPPHLPWIALIVGLLLIGIGASVALFVVAQRHPAEVVPDYYHQAAAYDSLQQVRRASEAATRPDTSRRR